MLVLTRKVGEKIKIGDDTVIRVLEISKGNVKVGIEAPRDVSIMRYEVYERIQEENIRSSRKTFSEIENAVKLWREKDKKE